MLYRITEDKELFSFDELDEHGRATAANDLLMDPWYFWTDIDAEKSWTVDPFFSTRPEWQADFSFSQGDGFNLYGDFSYNELRACVGCKPLKEDIDITIKPNRYAYCKWDRDYYGADILYRIEEERGEKFAERQAAIVDRICDFMAARCKELREYGETLIFDVYPNESSIYEGQLFDRYGHFVCTEEDKRLEACAF